MPYILQENRKKYNSSIDELAKSINENGDLTAGTLNYVITRLLLQVYADKLPKYDTYNEIIGLLECAKLELYRKQISKYEDDKAKENGEVIEAKKAGVSRMFEGSKL